MATQVQLRRGTSTQNDSFTGAQGELTFDTTNKRVRIHDGATAGGFELKTENAGGDTLFADNEKAIFGAGSDLQIYHDGSSNRSYITESNTHSNGHLFIQGDNLILANAGGGNYFRAINGGAVQLYHAGEEKLATTSTGIDVTGTAVVDGLTVDGAATVTGDITQATGDLKYTGGGNWDIAHHVALQNLILKTTPSGGSVTPRVRVSHDGDVSFYEATGTTPKFHWDAADQRLGLGTTSPDNLFHLLGSGNVYEHIQSSSDTNVGLRLTNTQRSWYLINDSSGNLQFYDNTAGTEAMRIDSSGKIKIGNNIPMWSGSYGGGLFLKGNNATGDRYAQLAIVDSTGAIANEGLIVDTNGNLLVGKTTTALATAGITLGESGFGSFTRSGFEPLNVNRLSSDGNLAVFYKDGTTVGSIGSVTQSGATNLVLDSTSAVYFDTSVRPKTDNTYDVGSGTYRFKDLYLSGTIEIENGTGNVSVGKQALNSNTATHNTAVGYQAGYNQTNGGHYNTYTGYRAGWRNTGGDFNTYYGHEAGFDNTGGTGNIFIGRSSGYYMDGGNYNTIIGGYNGNQGGLDIRTSSNHIVLADGNGNPRLVINSNGRQAFANGNANGHGNFVGEVGTSSKALMFEHTVNGGETGSITTGSSSTSYNTSSDHRLKENVDYTWDATTRLKQLKPARFNFIADADTTVDGFLAHEVQAVVPEAVHGTHNEVDDDGNAVMQGIDQSKLVPLLVKTIQELEARITALEGA